MRNSLDWHVNVSRLLVRNVPAGPSVARKGFVKRPALWGNHIVIFRIFVYMLSVAGIYDGKNIHPLNEINDRKKYKVIITFVEELENAEAEDSDIRNFGTAHASLDFWDNPEEDIYQDYLTSAKDK